MKGETYRALVLSFTREDVPEALSGVLFLHGCQGIYEAAPREWIVYFPGDMAPDHLRALRDRLRHQFGEVLADIREAAVADEDWNARWRQYFKPLEVAPAVWVTPPWETLPPDAKGTVIVINPQMGFGTGHHETTRLMLRRMSRMHFEGKRVLDVGTGSGILAIFARKRGAARVVAVDIDADAIDNARENLALNQVDGVELKVGDISTVPPEPFDVVLANIQLPVLRELGSAFRERLVRGGTVLVSGLLERDAGVLEPLYVQHGLRLLLREQLGEWILEEYVCET